MDPSTETGNSLLRALTDLHQKNLEIMGLFQRIVFMYSPKIINEDAFITYLYGQGAVDQLPLDMMKKLGTPSPLLRLQHAIDTSFKNQCNQALIVALEWSDNREVLAQLLSWAQQEIGPPAIAELEADNDTKKPEGEVTVSQLFLLAKSITKGATSTEAAGKTVVPRSRSIIWENCEKLRSIVTLDDYILLIWEEEIGIYTREHLACTAILRPDFGGSSSFCCVDSNDERIIAGATPYVYLWDIKSGKLVLEPQNTRKRSRILGFFSCVKYKQSEAVIGTRDGELSLWSVKNNFLNFERGWGTWQKKGICSVDLDERMVISLIAPKCLIQVWDKRGTLLRQLQDVNFANGMKYLGGRIVTLYKDLIRRWDAHNLKCNGSFECHYVMDMNDKYILSWDYSGNVSIWSLEAVFGDGQEATTSPLHRLELQGDTSRPSEVSLENNFVVCYRGDRKSVEILEFE